MTWTWRFEGADGAQLHSVPGVAQPPHPSQSDAENWLGENWRALADSGVAQVRLFDGAAEVYGPMLLAEG